VIVTWLHTILILEVPVGFSTKTSQSKSSEEILLLTSSTIVDSGAALTGTATGLSHSAILPLEIFTTSPFARLRLTSSLNVLSASC
jgi:hypothetical protein